MKVNTFVLNLTSERPEKLKSFYADIVGLPPAEGFGADALAAGGAILIFDGHSETRGRAQEPQRYLIDFYVDDLAAEQSRLEGQGVEFVRKGGKAWWGGVISTFCDPDGNYGQLIEFKEMPGPQGVNEA